MTKHKVMFKGREVKKGSVLWYWRGGLIDRVDILRVGPKEILLKMERYQSPFVESTYDFFDPRKHKNLFWSERSAQNMQRFHLVQHNIEKVLREVTTQGAEEKLDDEILGWLCSLTDEITQRFGKKGSSDDQDNL